MALPGDFYTWKRTPYDIPAREVRNQVPGTVNPSTGQRGGDPHAITKSKLYYSGDYQPWALQKLYNTPVLDTPLFNGYLGGGYYNPSPRTFDTSGARRPEYVLPDNEGLLAYGKDLIEHLYVGGSNPDWGGRHELDRERILRHEFNHMMDKNPNYGIEQGDPLRMKYSGSFNMIPLMDTDVWQPAAYVGPNIRDGFGPALFPGAYGNPKGDWGGAEEFYAAFERPEWVPHEFRDIYPHFDFSRVAYPEISYDFSDYMSSQRSIPLGGSLYNQGAETGINELASLGYMLAHAWQPPVNDDYNLTRLRVPRSDAVRSMPRNNPRGIPDRWWIDELQAERQGIRPIYG